MNIHIIGAGAIGMLLAGKLAAAHHAAAGGRQQEEAHRAGLLLVTRTTEQASAINERGLLMEESGRAEPVRLAVETVGQDAYRSGLASGAVGRADCVMLAVKQRHIDERLAALLRLAASPGGGIVCWQNGIGHLEFLTDRLPGIQLASAVTTEGARKDGPRSVAHTGTGWTKLGGGEKFWMKSVKNALEQAGFTVMLSKQIHKDAWNKLTINSVINPLTAMYGLRNGELLASPYLLMMMRRLLDEAAAAAAAEGVQLDPSLWEQLLEVCRRTAGNASSMLQDIRAGRPTEIDHINGSILRAARKRNLSLPAQETVYRAIRGSEPSL